MNEYAIHKYLWTFSEFTFVFSLHTIFKYHVSKTFSLLSLFINNLFTFGRAGSLLMHGLFSSCEEGGYSLLQCAGFSCGDLSCCADRALGHMGSVLVAPGL